MSTTDLGSLEELRLPGALPGSAALHGILYFAKKKPLGAFCGVLVIIAIIVGDLVPETLNKVTSTAGLGTPVPYVADALQKSVPFIYPYSFQDLENRLQGPSSDHLLGTDQLGRDIFSRLIYGARVVVMVSFGAELITQAVGASIGIFTAYHRGWVDKFAYRFVDILQALPGLVVLITVLGLFGSGLWQLVFVIGFLGAPGVSRIHRSQAISIMSSPFIESAKSIGASDLRIMYRHILPNLLPLIILSSTVRLGFVVLLEASLSFLGYGLPPPFPDWGQMLSLEGRQYMRTQPGLAMYPGFAIALLVFSYNMFGDAVRDVLDPRLRGNR
jgi:peptide/nickel transport system permease protein